MGFLKTIEIVGECLLIALIFGLPAYLYLTHLAGAKYRKAFFGRRVIKEQSMEIPLEGDFYAAVAVASYMYKSDDKDMTEPATAAMYLKWLKDGIMSEGAEGNERCLMLLREDNPFKDSLEKKLFAFAQKASQDGHSLTQFKLGGWAYLHHTQVIAGSDFVQHGIKWFKQHGYFVKDGVFSPVLTPAGQAAAVKVVELKNYLEASSKGKAPLPSADAPVIEYMRYALLFGCEEALCQAWQSILPQGFASTLKMCKSFISHMEIERSLAFDKANGLD